ncbi:hypothetical protein [Coraliomargarita parva]|uniref:hypothetical protein n=1 Tax=Coraliomargarita parva TaxID=3014050 RepID=UPI0022B4824B|nr:hypothetical protein [Coraliomargarita parva]
MSFSTIRSSVSILLALATMTGTASASLVAYDGFDGYTAGTALNGGAQGSGWTSDWAEATAGDSTIQTAGLIDPNGLVSGGSQALLSQPTAARSNVDDYLTRTFAAQAGDVYISFLLQAGTGIDTSDFYNFQVSNGATGNASDALGVGIRNTSGNPFFARVGSSNDNATTNSLTSSTTGETFLVVAKFSKDGSTEYNRTDLYLNPTSSSEPLTADASATADITGLSEISLFSVRNYNPESGDTIWIDELRIGTTFASVVPEPSSFALIAGFMSMTWVMLRRR